MSREQHATAPSSFERDLENARVLIEESPWKENPQKYRKVAEAIVRRVLSFDPSNVKARRLLAKASETPITAPQPETPVLQAKNIEAPVTPPKQEISVAPLKLEVPAAPPKPKPEPVRAPAKVIQLFEPPSRRPAARPELTFKVETPRPVAAPKPGRPSWTLIALAVVGAVAGVTLLVAHRNTFTAQYPAKTPRAVPKVVQASSAPITRVPAAPLAPAPPGAAGAVVEHPLAPPPPPPPPPQPAPKVETVTPQPTVVVKSNVQPVAPSETGTLAVSSPTTVDIYLNDQLVGSAPTTIVLPAGNQTVEYRHQDLRKVVTHTIKANDTTTAMITFDVTVQINAKPWAQVFIDGSKRQPLGQTPLSDVRVPIGSNLIFENPNFPGKSYRVTGKEAQIRVNFP